MDAYQFRWQLEFSEMITVQDVKKEYPYLGDQQFAELVLDLIVGTAGDKIHFASYLNGYLAAAQEFKIIYAKDPLALLEALDGECNCDDN